MRRARSWNEEANRLIQLGEDLYGTTEEKLTSYRTCLQNLTRDYEFLNLKISALENSANADCLNKLISAQLDVVNAQWGERLEILERDFYSKLKQLGHESVEDEKRLDDGVAPQRADEGAVRPQAQQGLFEAKIEQLDKFFCDEGRRNCILAELKVSHRLEIQDLRDKFTEQLNSKSEKLIELEFELNEIRASTVSDLREKLEDITTANKRLSEENSHLKKLANVADLGDTLDQDIIRESGLGSSTPGFVSENISFSSEAVLASARNFAGPCQDFNTSSFVERDNALTEKLRQITDGVFECDDLAIPDIKDITIPPVLHGIHGNSAPVVSSPRQRLSSDLDTTLHPCCLARVCCLHENNMSVSGVDDILNDVKALDEEDKHKVLNELGNLSENRLESWAQRVETSNSNPVPGTNDMHGVYYQEIMSLLVDIDRSQNYNFGESKGQLDTFDFNIRQLNNVKTFIHDQSVKWEADLKTSKEELLKSAVQEKQLTSANEALESQLASYVRDFQEAESERIKLVKDCAKLRDKLAQQKNVASRLEGEKTKYMLQISKLEEDLVKSVAVFEECQREKDQLAEMLEMCQSDCSTAQMEFENARYLVKVGEKHIKEQGKTIEECNKELKAEHEKVVSMTIEIDRLEVENKILVDNAGKMDFMITGNSSSSGDSSDFRNLLIRSDNLTFLNSELVSKVSDLTEKFDTSQVETTQYKLERNQLVEKAVNLEAQIQFLEMENQSLASRKGQLESTLAEKVARLYILESAGGDALVNSGSSDFSGQHESSLVIDKTEYQELADNSQKLANTRSQCLMYEELVISLIADLCSQKTGSNEKVEHANALHENCEHQKRQFIECIEKLISEKSTLEENLNLLHEESKDLKNLFDVQSGELTSATSEIELQSRKFRDLEREFEAQKVHIIKVEERNCELEQHMSGTKAAYDELLLEHSSCDEIRENFESEIQRFKLEISESEAMLIDIKSEISRLSQAEKDATLIKNELQIIVKNSKENKEMFAKENATLRQAVAEIKHENENYLDQFSEFENIKADKNTLEIELRTARNQLHASCDVIEQLRSHNSDLLSKVEHLTEIEEEIKEKLSNRDLEFTRISDISTQKDRNINSLNDNLLKLKSEFDVILAEKGSYISTLESENAEFINEISVLQETAMQLGSTLESLQVRNRELETILAEQNHSKTELQASLASKEGVIVCLQSNNSLLNEKQNMLTTELENGQKLLDEEKSEKSDLIEKSKQQEISMHSLLKQTESLANELQIKIQHENELMSQLKLLESDVANSLEDKLTRIIDLSVDEGDCVFSETQLDQACNDDAISISDNNNLIKNADRSPNECDSFSQVDSIKMAFSKDVNTFKQMVHAKTWPQICRDEACSREMARLADKFDAIVSGHLSVLASREREASESNELIKMLKEDNTQLQLNSEKVSLARDSVVQTLHNVASVQLDTLRLLTGCAQSLETTGLCVDRHTAAPSHSQQSVHPKERTQQELEMWDMDDGLSRVRAAFSSNATFGSDSVGFEENQTILGEESCVPELRQFLIAGYHLPPPGEECQMYQIVLRSCEELKAYLKNFSGILKDLQLKKEDLITRENNIRSLHPTINSLAASAIAAICELQPDKVTSRYPKSATSAEDLKQLSSVMELVTGDLTNHVNEVKKLKESAHALEEVRESNSQLRATMDQKSAEMNGYKEELQDLLTRNSEMRRIQEQLRAREEELKQFGERLARDKESAEAAAESLKSQLEQVTIEAQTRNEESLQQVLLELDRIRGAVRERDTELERCRQEVDQLADRLEHRTVLDLSQSQINAAQQELSFDESMQKLRSAVDRNTAAVTQLKEQASIVERLQISNLELKESVKSKAEEISQLQDYWQQAQDTLYTREKEVSDLRVQGEQAKVQADKAVAELQKELDGTRKKLSEVETQGSAAAEKLEELRKELGHRRGIMDFVQGRADQIADSVKLASGQSKENQNDAGITAGANPYSKTSEFGESMRVLEASVEEQGRALAATREECQRLRDAEAGLRSQLEDRVAEGEECRVQVQQLHTDLSESQK